MLKKQRELLTINIDKLAKLTKIVEAQYANGFAKKIDIDRQKQLEYKDNIITNTQNQIKKLKLKFIVSSIALVGILLVI